MLTCRTSIMRTLLPLAFVAAGAAVCATVCAGLAMNSGNADDVVPAPPVRTAGHAGVFGPGALPTASLHMPPSFSPPVEPAVDEQGNLVVDTSLLQLLDYFLVGRGEQGRADLDDYLAARLAEPARHQGIDLAGHYADYMAEHDRQLAAQHAGLDSLPRVQAWLEQRTRLRSATIGDATARAWYQNDDAQLRQAIFELSNAGDPAVPGVPQWQNAEAAARHQRYLQRIVGKNLLSYTERTTSGNTSAETAVGSPR